jgi:hypothetical protein
MPRTTAAERKAQAQRQAEIADLLRGPTINDLQTAMAEAQRLARAELAAQPEARAQAAAARWARLATGPVVDTTEPAKRT